MWKENRSNQEAATDKQWRQDPRGKVSLLSYNGAWQDPSEIAVNSLHLLGVDPQILGAQVSGLANQCGKVDTSCRHPSTGLCAIPFTFVYPRYQSISDYWEAPGRFLH